MSALFRYASLALAALATALITVLLSAGAAAAKLDPGTPIGGSPGGAEQPPLLPPVTTIVEAGLGTWYVVAIVVGVAALTAAVTVVLTSHHMHHLPQPGITA